MSNGRLMWLEQTSNALFQINLTQSINLQYIFLSHIADLHCALCAGTLHWEMIQFFHKTCYNFVLCTFLKELLWDINLGLEKLRCLREGFYFSSLVMQDKLFVLIVQLIEERWAISFLTVMVQSKTKTNEWMSEPINHTNRLTWALLSPFGFL